MVSGSQPARARNPPQRKQASCLLPAGQCRANNAPTAILMTASFNTAQVVLAGSPACAHSIFSPLSCTLGGNTVCVALPPPPMRSSIIVFLHHQREQCCSEDRDHR